MSGWIRCCGISTALAAAFALNACGGQRQDANEPKGNFPVAIAKATFPTSQRLSQHTHLVIAVQNTGTKTIPDVAVTITNPASGDAAQAFGELLSQEEANSLGLASRSRAVWIVDQPPGLCGYSCKQGGFGGAVTAYTNTWALGALKPGGTATFDWGLTAVNPGTYEVQWQVAAGLNGKAKAVLADGTMPTGRFRVTIHTKPSQAYVNNAGKVVKTQ